MSGNIFGKEFTITTYGESHGKSVGVVIDGCPAGLDLNKEFIQQELARRRPGQSAIVTQRKEEDTVEIYSGIFEGKSTGTPIHLMIFNQDQKSKDYSHIAKKFRPSHADFTWQKKFGIRDYRGGGRSSARETTARVAAGAVAKQILSTQRIHINAYVSQVGDIKCELSHEEVDLSLTESNPVRCPHPQSAIKMEQLIRQVRKEGDTVGGIITGLIKNVPAGIGEPVFDKLHADLGKAMLSINACKGFEFGSGFAGVTQRGSEHNDPFISQDGKTSTTSNNSGGIQGGISNGMDIYFRVAFKPVATIMRDQQSIDSEDKPTVISGKGRHDPCVVPRAVPIVEAMAAIVITDHLLRSRMNKL